MLWSALTHQISPGHSRNLSWSLTFCSVQCWIGQPSVVLATFVFISAYLLLVSPRRPRTLSPGTEKHLSCVSKRADSMESFPRVRLYSFSCCLGQSVWQGLSKCVGEERKREGGKKESQRMERKKGRKREREKLGMGTHICNPSSWEVEAGGLL